MRCSGILEFVSAPFVGSKYCGREVRFGAVFNKKIAPIYLKSVELSGGMNVILHATQRVMMIQKRDSTDIESAIKAHMPMTYVGCTNIAS